MADSVPDVPVHDALVVTNAETIYKTGEWWKGVVTYHYERSESEETAIYLWHKEDDGWTRKNKYVIKTVDAWETDRQIIETLLSEEQLDDVSDEFPVSDYYTAGGGVTVFQSDEWWKAILNIVQKGSYETDEVMVYLWQDRDGAWKRRQKYTIKSQDDWEEERAVIESVLDTQDTSNESSTVGPAGQDDAQDKDEWDDLEMMPTQELADLSAELDDHLSKGLD